MLCVGTSYQFDFFAFARMGWDGIEWGGVFGMMVL